MRKRGFPRTICYLYGSSGGKAYKAQERRLLLRLMAWQLVRSDGCRDCWEAFGAIEAIFQGQFGSAGKFVLVEECLTGQSFGFGSDGWSDNSPLATCSGSQAGGEGDGREYRWYGAYAPAPLVTPVLMARIEQVLQPAIATLRQRGIDYRGVLYAGLMITADGDLKVWV